MAMGGGMHPGPEGHLGAIGQHGGIDMHGGPGGIHERGGGGGGQSVKKGIQTSPDGTVKNIPPSMVTDQFGMIGLLTFIRAAETDPNLVSLALGADLTTLGLNLNSEVILSLHCYFHDCKVSNINIEHFSFKDAIEKYVTCDYFNK